MRDFTFHRPDSLEQAGKLFDGSDDGRFMAGGQTLIPVMKQGLSASEDIIELGRIEQLKGITAAGDSLSIGAMATHAAVAASSPVQSAIPALAALAGDIGDPHVRNRGTIGGSIANNRVGGFLTVPASHTTGHTDHVPRRFPLRCNARCLSVRGVSPWAMNQSRFMASVAW